MTRFTLRKHQLRISSKKSRVLFEASANYSQLLKLHPKRKRSSYIYSNINFSMRWHFFLAFYIFYLFIFRYILQNIFDRYLFKSFLELLLYLAAIKTIFLAFLFLFLLSLNQFYIKFYILFDF